VFHPPGFGWLSDIGAAFRPAPPQSSKLWRSNSVTVAVEGHPVNGNLKKIFGQYFEFREMNR
jgi:hypothetical protein